MKYEKISDLKEEEFKRLTGVKKETFDSMVKIVKEAHKKKRKEEEKISYVLKI